ncbi:hypothetical protein CACET_c31180 [Clostridium aceticum]|uniref:Uncharacterized protein n=1 Tax=Clostridium aceticum TaxID=84022 RepID=A0A0D8IDK1_9CLOT|nr:hypothetical protein [Clostridium aceticum]AKL96562.1 hypothetical protein CACET_c31180 [Clostridium aceticum]KJF27281.1 hypothetical protein TZ02_08005 [Clostridium aceticum]
MKFSKTRPYPLSFRVGMLLLLLGTDLFGRDVLTRTLYGGQTTLISSFLTLGIVLVLGISFGMLTDGSDHFFQAPYILMSSALFIMFIVLALNLIGEGLRHQLDPFEKLKM